MAELTQNLIPLRGRNSNSGFGMISVMVGVMLVGIMAAAIVPTIREMMDNAAMNAERMHLRAISEAIQKSFLEDTPRNVTQSGLNNRTFMSGNINAAANGTFTANQFLNSWTPGLAASEDDYAQESGYTLFKWEHKLALLLNGDSLGSDPTRIESRLADDTGALLFNARGNKRLLIRGPSGESGMQRWLLLSVMIPPHRQIRDLPVMTFDQLFLLGNSSSQQLPGGGTAANIALAALWNAEEAGKTNASRIIIEKFVQRLYTVNMTNSSTDRYMHIQLEDAGTPTTRYYTGVTGDGTDTATAGNFVLSPGEVMPSITVAHGTRITVFSGVLKSSLRTNTAWTPVGATFAPAVGADITEGPTPILQFRIQDTTTLVLNPTGSVGGG